MSTTTPEKATDTLSLLTRLRALAPKRSLSLFEALRLAELQANRLLELSNVTGLPVPSEIISSLPRICVEYDFDMPDHAAGASVWDTTRKTWVITLNPAHPDTRQHFTLSTSTSTSSTTASPACEATSPAGTTD